MKTFLRIPLSLPMIWGLLVFVAGCNGDKNEEDPGKDLYGLWTISEVEIDARVGDQSFIEYLVSEAGISGLEAELYWSIFETLLMEELDQSGTIEIMENNTYTSNLGGYTEDGTWELSPDGKTLTFDAGTMYETDLTINALTSSVLNLSMTEVSMEDLDDDPLTPDVEIVVEVTLELSK